VHVDATMTMGPLAARFTGCEQDNPLRLTKSDDPGIAR
jgi:hypothetical protein